MTCSFLKTCDQMRCLLQFVLLQPFPLHIAKAFQRTTGEGLLEGGEVSIVWKDEVAGIHITCPPKQLEGDFGDNTKDGASSS